LWWKNRSLVSVELALLSVVAEVGAVFLVAGCASCGWPTESEHWTQQIVIDVCAVCDHTSYMDSLAVEKLASLTRVPCHECGW